MNGIIQPSSAPLAQNQINHYKKLINNKIREYKETKSNNENKSKKKNNKKKIFHLFTFINEIQRSEAPEIKNKLKEYSRPKRKEILSNFHKKYPINNNISNFDYDNFRRGMEIALEGQKLYYEAMHEKDSKKAKNLYNAAFHLFKDSYENYNNPVACEYISHYYSERTIDDFQHNRKLNFIVGIRAWAKDINSNIKKNEEMSKKYLIKAMQILRTIPNKYNLFDSFGINYSDFSSRIKTELYFVHHVREGTYNKFQLNI